MKKINLTMLRFHRESYKQETEVTNESSGGQTEGGGVIVFKNSMLLSSSPGSSGISDR
jgi:hypothetical protein